jgi:hypothetical protein
MSQHHHTHKFEILFQKLKTNYIKSSPVLEELKIYLQETRSFLTQIRIFVLDSLFLRLGLSVKLLLVLASTALVEINDQDFCSLLGMLNV